MKTRVMLVMSLCVATSCGMREPRPVEVNVAKLFDGFTYIGSYPSSPLLRVPGSQLSRDVTPPTRAKNGLAFVYRKASNETFETLAQSVLPRRLKAQGFAVQATPESNVTSYATSDDGAAFTIVFSRGRCSGYLFGRQKSADEKFVLQLDSDSGCPAH
jgi:hypothetical protein